MNRIDPRAWPECDECCAPEGCVEVAPGLWEHRRVPVIGVVLCLVVAAATTALLAWAGFALVDRVAASCARPAPVSSGVML